MSGILAPDGSPARVERSEKRSSARAQSWWQVYEAADRRDFRGYFYLPTLKPEEQLNGLTRAALTERIDFLYKNVPEVGMVIDGLAIEEAGTGLWPKWTTSDPDFNREITNVFHEAAKEPRLFSADGETDYYTAQINVRRMCRLYGDGFGQLLRPPDGMAHPQCHMLPGWQIDGVPSGAAKDSGWADGIQRNGLRRAVNYLVQNGKRGGGEIVPASDMLHFHDPFLPGQTRGVSCLASIAKRLFRREDILKALANGTLARERLGFAIETKEGESGGMSASDIDDIPGEGETETVTRDDGSKYTLKKIFGPNATEDIEIPELPPGSTIKTLESDRPGTAVMEFLDSVLHGLARSSLYPAEYIFFIADLGQGTAARIVLTRVRRIVKVRRWTQLIPQFCNRWHVFHAWQLIKSGYFERRKIKVPPDWWKHMIREDGDPSVDIGREGRLLDDRVATGKMSIDLYHAINGEDGDDVETDNFAVMKRRMAKLKKFNAEEKTNFDYFDVWPRTVNNQPTPPDGEAPGKGKKEKGSKGGED